MNKLGLYAVCFIVFASFYRFCGFFVLRHFQSIFFINFNIFYFAISQYCNIFIL